MGPKTFVACYVCLKEFGSKSIPFHEPKCLERWRACNRNLPADKRTPTPVKPTGWKNNQDGTWTCCKCLTSVPSNDRGQHAMSCKAKKPKSAATTLANNNNTSPETMTGVKSQFSSPRKGKENKYTSNHGTSVVRNNAKNDAKANQKEDSPDGKKDKVSTETSEPSIKEGEEVTSTSRRSVRPQTKILRRPTPNLNHPVIQVDSDDSSIGGNDSSSSSDKTKEENPKRPRMGNESLELSSSSSSSHKRKNFIMYNKYNVDKNIKSKDRVSAGLPAGGIPNPCNSCNRSQAPERLHSHVKRDSRGLMYRKSPSLDIKMTSPQKKVSDKTKVEKSPKSPSNPNGSKVETKKKDEIVENRPPGEGTSDEKQLILSENIEVDKKCERETGSDEDKGENSSPGCEFVDLVKPCYICQLEFKVSELLLHESKCLESWKKSNNSLNPNQRQLPPRRPELIVPLEEDDPAWAAVQSQLVPCPQCGRTFFPERLPVHRRVCKGKPSPRPLKRASSLREQPSSPREGDEVRPVPVYLPCYVCSRNYGSWVLPMHEQQCLKRWRRRNDELPPGQRQEEPTKPPGSGIDDDVASLVELGDNAWESHLQQLVPCPRCSRTFFPDRLDVHQRSCKGPSCGRRPRSNKGT